MRVTTALLLAVTTFAAQLPPPPPPPPPGPQGVPPRDVVRRPEPTGTGVIRGRVVAADTGAPIRRGNVNLAPAPPAMPTTPPGASPAGTSQTFTTMVNGVAQTMTLTAGATAAMARPRSVTTDSQGAFEFTGLPAGSYRLFASPGQYSAAYLSSAYGAKRVSTPLSPDNGTPIDLAEGQQFGKATISLPRGAVITGRVSDESGEPLARLQVFTLIVMPGTTRGQRTGGFAQTDDLGQFRIFGLQPGDYLVAAEARASTYVQPNAPAESEDDKVGFLTTYFPGTADEGSAQRIRARAGAETPGAEIRMVSGRLFHLSGTITDSQGRPSSRTSGSLVRNSSNGSSSFGFGTDEQGRFQMRNIPPGNYRLIARARQDSAPGGQADPGEAAILPLTLNSDMDGLVLSTSPGATIVGQVVFEQGPPLLTGGQTAPQLRVTATSGDPQNFGAMPTPQPAQVTPDLTFQMKGMFGEFLLRASTQGQFLKAVMLGAEDITDTPHEFKNGERVTLVLTSRASTVEGTVTDTKGTPVTDAGVLLFSEDKAAWRFNSVRVRRGALDQAGHYKVSGILPGRYFIIAAPRERLFFGPANQDPSYFEQLVKDATTVIVGEDENRQVDLKIAPGAGGGL